jgi:hypothetical protein
MHYQDDYLSQLATRNFWLIWHTMQNDLLKMLGSKQARRSISSTQMKQQ